MDAACRVLWLNRGDEKAGQDDRGDPDFGSETKAWVNEADCDVPAIPGRSCEEAGLRLHLLERRVLGSDCAASRSSPVLAVVMYIYSSLAAPCLPSNPSA